LKDAFSWAGIDLRTINLRQLGTILAFDMKPYYSKPQFAQEFYAKALAKGLLIRPIGQTVYVMPPYIVNLEQVQFLGSTVQSILNEVCPL
jgi:adenosylmethionine-8-amino-7-oxononanoate aminotransferase